MRKQFTVAIKAFMALILFSALIPSKSFGQCADGEVEYTLTLAVGGSFVGERGVQIVPTAGGAPVFELVCGTYPTAPANGTASFNFCVVPGVEYTANFYDSFGDGWNFATTVNPVWQITNGAVTVASGGNPSDGVCCNITTCFNGDIEASATFTAVELNCTPPDFDFSVVDNCETQAYTLFALLNDFGSTNGVPNFSAVVELTRSDAVEVDPVTLISPLVGQNVPIIENVPFGVTVTAQVTGFTIFNDFSEDCILNFSFQAQNICPPPNDECTEAIAAECGGEYAGSIANAAALNPGLVGLPFCGTSFTTGGVWYEFTAPFNAIVTANTFGSNFDTKLHILQSDDCATFTCLAGNDDFAGLQSQIIFNASVGDTYYIYVSRFSTFTTAGNFELNILCEELVCEFPDLTATAVDADGNPIDGCLEAGTEVFVEVLITGGAGNSSFTLTANGLSEPNAVADQPITFGPFLAGQTINVTAVGNDDDLCDATTSASTTVCPPSNDVCADAIALECNSTVFGNTSSATSDNVCSFFGTGIGVWYTLNVENTTFVELETCNPGTDFDTDLSVFTGSCEAVSCFSGFSGDGWIDGVGSCAFAGFAAGGPDANFTANPGTTYYILLHGFGGPVGNFELSVTCTEILCESPTVTATAVDADGNAIDGCLPFGSQFFVLAQLSGGSGNDTYNITANGVNPQVVPADGSFTFGPYNPGTLVNIAAVGLDDNLCEAFASATAVFCPPSNDDCADAISATCGGTYEGTTQGATNDPAQLYCGTSAPATTNGGVWYEFVLDDEADVDIDLSGSLYDTKVFLYSGTCDALTCVTGDDDGGDGLDSRIQTTLTGGTYYIYISGFGTSRGQYLMNISCVNAACSPTIAVTAVADAEGNPIGECVPQGGSYFVSVTLSGGSGNDFYNVSVNGGAPVSIAAEGTGIVGPVPAGATANVSAVGQTNNTCSAEGAVTPALCPPTNDQPCDAINIPVDGTVYGPYNNAQSTTDAGEPVPQSGTCVGSQAVPEWCDGFGNPDGSAALDNTIWFTFVAPASGKVRIQTCHEGAGIDNQLAIYTAADCNDYGTYELIAANDDADFSIFGACAFGAFRSGIELCSLTPGEEYYIQLDGYAGSVGNNVISITEVETASCDCVPPNFPPDFFLANTFPVCEGEGSPGFSVSFFAPEDLGTSEFIVYTYNYGSVPPTVIEVPAGGQFDVDDVIPLNTLVFITATLSDPACEVGAGFPISGAITQGTAACDPDCEGVAGGTADPGTPCTTTEGEPGIYNANCECIPTPANDICENAIEVACGETVTGSTVSAGVDNVCSFFGTGNGVWYSFTSDVSGTITLETCQDGTDFDSDLSVYTGSCESLSCFSGFGGGGWIDGNFSCPFAAFASSGTFEAEAGVTYYILVHGFGGAVGDFALTVSCELAEEASIAGSVTWNSNCGTRDAVVSVYEPGTNTLVGSYPVTVQADGTFNTSTVPTGTYDIIVKVQGYLAKGFQDVAIALGPNALAVGAITNGDVNNNNGINIQDVSTLNAAFGSVVGAPNYNFLANLNCDNGVNIVDVSILNAGFGQTGAVAPL